MTIPHVLLDGRHAVLGPPDGQGRQNFVGGAKREVPVAERLCEYVGDGLSAMVGRPLRERADGFTSTKWPAQSVNRLRVLQGEQGSIHGVGVRWQPRN